MERERLGSSEDNPKGMTKGEELELEQTVQQQLEAAEKRAADAKTPELKKKRMANVYYWRKRVKLVSGKAGKPVVRVGAPELSGHSLVIPVFIEVPLHLKVRPIMELELGDGPEGEKK